MRKPLPIRPHADRLRSLSSALHRRGLRFRKIVQELPGHPHLVFPSRRIIVFVCDCHQYQHHCPTAERWITPDAHTRAKELLIFETVLASRGWRVAIVWACEQSADDHIPTKIKGLFEIR